MAIFNSYVSLPEGKRKERHNFRQNDGDGDILHSLKIFNKGLILPSGLNFYIRWRSSLMMVMVMVIMILMMTMTMTIVAI